MKDLDFVYLPNLHKLKHYNFGLWFVGCTNVTNLPIEVGVVSPSIIVLSYTRFKFVYSHYLHKLKCYNFGSWFIGCTYIMNLPIGVEMASVSTIVLK